MQDVTQVGDHKLQLIAWGPSLYPYGQEAGTVDFIQEVEDKIKEVVNHTRTAVAKALSVAKAKADEEKAIISGDVRKAAADALAALKADAPEIEAALKAGGKAIVDAVEAELKAHNL